MLAEDPMGDHCRSPVVILSIGIRPNTGFLQDTGMEMFKGTILVDDKMPSPCRSPA